MKACLSLLAVFLLLNVLVSSDDGALSKFKITTKKEDDGVEVRADTDKTLFVVKSLSGISQAVVERKVNKWPAAVILRLHLTGLERLRISNGRVTLDASVAAQDGKLKVRLWKDGKENALLDSNSPLWMVIRMVGGDGKPAKEIPLKDGYFEMALPKAFFKGNPRSITVDWIDFYRN